MIRYQNTPFYSIDGVQYTIQIWDSSFIGDSTDFNLDKQGFQLSYQNVSQRMDAVFASSCAVPFMVENSSQETAIHEMMLAAEERFGVKVYKGASLYWVGILAPDMMDLPDEYFPYVVNLKFIDGLGRLKDKMYNADGKVTSTTPYTGRDTIIAHIIKCLNWTGTTQYFSGSDTFIKTIDRFYESRHSGATVDPIAATNINHLAFFTIDEQGVYEWTNCYDVLSDLLQTFNLCVFMANGIFNIYQRQEYVRAMVSNDVRSWSYYKTGVQKSTTSPDTSLIVNASALKRAAGGMSKFMPALYYVSRKYKYRYANGANDNLLPQQTTYYPSVNFTNTLQSSLLGEYLSFSGTIHEQYTIPGSSSVLPAFQAVYKLRVTLLVGSTYYYLKGGTDGSYQWTTTNTDYVKVTGYVGNAGWDWINDTMVDFSTDPLPGSGTATFMFQHIGFQYPTGASYTPPAGYTFSFYCQSYTMSLFVTTGAMAGETLYSNIPSSVTTATTKLELKETVIGDGPYTYSIGGLYTYNGSSWAKSVLWGYTYGGGGSYEYNINMLNITRNMAGQVNPVELFHGTFVGSSLSPEKAIVWGTKVLVPLQMVVNPATDDIQGQWFDANYGDEPAVIGTEGETTTPPGANRSTGQYNPANEIQAQLPIVDNKRMTADFSATIPAGYMVDCIVIENHTASACQLSFGTTSSGSEIHSGYAISASDLVAISLNKLFSTSADVTIYVNTSSPGDTWNHCEVSFYLSLRKII